MMLSGILGSIRVERSRKLELLCFSFNLVEIWHTCREQFRDANYKKRPKLKLEMISAKQLQVSTDFSPNYTMHSSTIVLPWQQWTFHGTGLYLK